VTRLGKTGAKKAVKKGGKAPAAHTARRAARRAK
jgi:hypothetical protein